MKSKNDCAKSLKQKSVKAQAENRKSMTDGSPPVSEQYKTAALFLAAVYKFELI